MEIMVFLKRWFYVTFHGTYTGMSHSFAFDEPRKKFYSDVPTEQYNTGNRIIELHKLI